MINNEILCPKLSITVKTKTKDFFRAVILITTCWGLVSVGCVFLGLLMYAQYHDCDPLKANVCITYCTNCKYLKEVDHDF